MMMLSRLLLGAVGLLFLLVGAGLLFNTTEAAANMGLVELAAAGRGTVRADIAGFFIGGALIQLVAAFRRDPSLLWPVQLLLLLALAGRCLTLVLDGPVAAGVPGMGVEIVILMLLIWCKRLWVREAS